MTGTDPADEPIAGRAVTLRTATTADLDRLVAIRSTPEVWVRWRGSDLAAEIAGDLESDELHLMVIEDEHGVVIGGIQWEAEEDPDYRHASIDVFLDPPAHGRGLGTDAVTTLVRHLFEVHDHHRLTIDPAADNAAAIACYRKVGFRDVGLMRQYERGDDDSWHDGLLMDLVRDEFVDDRPPLS